MACGHLKVGAPDWSSFHHISQLVPEDPRDQAQFSLPGDIKVIGETFVIGAIPSVRLVLPGHCKGEWVAANLHFAEHKAMDTVGVCISAGAERISCARITGIRTDAL